MKAFFARFFWTRSRVVPHRRRQGQTLVEYALILAIISVVAVGVFAQLGQQVVRVFSGINTLLDTAAASH